MSDHDKKINVFEEQIVCCNGEGDDVNYTEHPRIYLNVKMAKKVVCPYCSKTFIYKF